MSAVLWFIPTPTPTPTPTPPPPPPTQSFDLSNHSLTSHDDFSTFPPTSSSSPISPSTFHPSKSHDFSHFPPTSFLSPISPSILHPSKISLATFLDSPPLSSLSISMLTKSKSTQINQLDFEKFDLDIQEIKSFNSQFQSSNQNDKCKKIKFARKRKILKSIKLRRQKQLNIKNEQQQKRKFARKRKIQKSRQTILQY